MKAKPNQKHSAYRSAFSSILFFDIYSPQIKSVPLLIRCALYGAAVLLFYAPIMAGTVLVGLYNYTYIPYLLCFVLMHIVSKILFHYTKIIQHRFTDAKKKRRFIIRILLVLEYIVLMWFVYLFYPITCILFPTTLIVVCFEKLMGFQFIFNLLITHMEPFIFYGGISAYVVFLFAGGYKKMMTGLMPPYLRMYIILAAVSGLINKVVELLTIEHLLDNLENFSLALSQIFSLSNQALNIVSTFVMFAYATYSLFTTCGIDADTSADTQELEAEQLE